MTANKGKTLTDDLLRGSGFAVADAKHWGRPLDALGMPPYLRVVTLQDGETIHNAFPDRNFTRQRRRRNG